MNREERYDIVIVGSGPNGTAAAAYLAKSGLSVCVLEERPECGGACENTEVIPGVRIDPHALFMYAAASPGFDQLELWKYGFRMEWKEDPRLRMAAAVSPTAAGRPQDTNKDVMGWAKLTGALGDPPFTRELLRSIFWCPPHPPEVEVTANNTPFMQVYKERQPDVWTEELLEMTLFELLDEYLETEATKLVRAMATWYSGAAPHWEGVAIPSLGGYTLLEYSGGGPPRGGMHAYFHSIIRCAIAHGAVFRTCCPVDEIIISNDRAVGVRLRDDAAWGAKTIWADKAVLSNIDIQQTFLKLVGPRHLDTSFIQRIKDVNLKGGSIYVSHFLFKGPPRYRPEFTAQGGGFHLLDTRDIYYEHLMDIDGRKGFPGMPPERVMWVAVAKSGTVSDACRIPDHYLVSPMYLVVPPPEYLVGGAESMSKEKDKWDAYMLEVYGQSVETDNIVHQWSNSPYDSEHRNAGLVGGNWMATRHCRDQFGQARPYALLPELARYQTPIDGLYLCHQTSAHPGGLCLMAIPYNLMHILIEDGIAEPGDWWYQSPWYIPREGKISAISR